MSNPSKRDRADMNFYSLMQIDDPSISMEDLHRHYKKLALKYHPDRLSHKSMVEIEEAKTQFQAITEAFRTLSDPEKRATYDSQLGVNFSGRVNAIANLAKTAGSRSDLAQGARSKDSKLHTAPEQSSESEEDEYVPEKTRCPGVAVSSGPAQETDEAKRGDERDSRHQRFKTTFHASVSSAKRRTVEFRLTRSDDTLPLGLKIDAKSLTLLAIMTDTVAAKCEPPLPTSAELPQAAPKVVSVDGTTIHSLQELAAACKGKLEICLGVSCFTQEIALPKSVLLDESRRMDEQQRSTQSDDLSWCISAGSWKLHRDPPNNASAQEQSVITKRVLRIAADGLIPPIAEEHLPGMAALTYVTVAA